MAYWLVFILIWCFPKNCAQWVYQFEDHLRLLRMHNGKVPKKGRNK